MSKTHRQSSQTANGFLRFGARAAQSLNPAAPDTRMPKRERQMAEHAIGWDGLHYSYHGYCYDRLADAVAYAELRRERSDEPDPGGSFTPAQPRVPPNETQLRLMALWSVDWEKGHYRFGPYRYDKLEDALNYAQLIEERGINQR